MRSPSRSAHLGSGLHRRQVLITQGGTGGLAATILGIVNPGDRVVIPEPTYSLYADLVGLGGGTVVRSPCAEDLHWDLDRLADALEGAKAFVFCNPQPDRHRAHPRRARALADLLAGTDTLVLSDEAYSDLVYTDTAFTSAPRRRRPAERTMYCQTFSKTYAMTGWRVGYLAGNPDVIAAAARVHALTAGPPQPGNPTRGPHRRQRTARRTGTMREALPLPPKPQIAGLPPSQASTSSHRTGRSTPSPLHSRLRPKNGRSPPRPRRGRPPRQRVRRCRRRPHPRVLRRRPGRHHRRNRAHPRRSRHPLTRSPP